VSLCPAQTSQSLNHPLRSSSESICAGQSEVQSVLEWGLCQHAPGRCLHPHTSKLTRWPAQWTSANGILDPLFHCSQHTSSFSVRGGGVTVPAADGHTENLMEHFTWWPFSSMLTSWALNHESIVLIITVFTGQEFFCELILDTMVYWFLERYYFHFF